MSNQSLPTIKWLKEDGEPFYRSADGRFEIEPLYLGRERPQGWQLRDNATKAVSRSFLGLKFIKEKASRIAREKIALAEK